MINTLPYPTREFPEGNELWRISWIGQFKLNPAARSEPTIQLVLDQYQYPKIDPNSITHKASYNLENTRVIEIGIGQLPPLSIGSFICNKKVIETPEYTTREYELTISSSTTQVVRMDATYMDGGRTYRYVPPAYYPLPEEMDATMCCVIERAITNESEVSRIIFPSGELLRFYFGTSTTLLKEIIKGGLDIGSNTIYNPQLTGLGMDGTAYVKLRKRVGDADAPVAALIGTSPYAQRVVRHIHASIERNSANGLGYIPEVLPPFLGQTRMRLHGKLINSGPNWHLLVFWIESCSAPFPFERLRWKRDNDGRKKGPTDPDLPEAWPKNVKPSGHSSSDEEDEPEVSSDDEPSLDRERTDVKLASTRFPDLLGKDIQKDVKLEQNYRAAGKPKFVPQDEAEGFGTADGQYHDTPLDRLEISHDLQGGEPPARGTRASQIRLPAQLTTFLKALEQLQQTPGMTCCNVLPVPPDDLTKQNKNISFFPQRLGKRMLKWSFIEYPQQRRQVIVAEVCYRGSWFYLFESERRPDTLGKTKERFVTLIVHWPQEARLKDQQMPQRILLHCAKKNGVWLNKWPWTNLLCKRFHHQPGTVAVFAGRFIKYMQKFVSSAEADPTKKATSIQASEDTLERREA
jgi:hypothetical protein